jgi:hypothetical protein
MGGENMKEGGHLVLECKSPGEASMRMHQLISNGFIAERWKEKEIKVGEREHGRPLTDLFAGLIKGFANDLALILFAQAPADPTEIILDWKLAGFYVAYFKENAFVITGGTYLGDLRKHFSPGYVEVLRQGGNDVKFSW